MFTLFDSLLIIKDASKEIWVAYENLFLHISNSYSPTTSTSISTRLIICQEGFFL